MINDIKFVLKRWRIVHALGISRLRERYARSKLGQLWLTLSNLVLIIVTGIVWSVIWKMQLDEYLPYVGVGHIIYLFISQTLNESTGIFIADARYYLNQYMPFLMSVFTHLYRSTLIFIHNIPIILGLVIWSNSAVVRLNISFIFSIVLLYIFLFCNSYSIAAISTRFRDLIQIFGLIFQLAFLVTPVMWQISFVPLKYRDYFMLNPLAAFLEMIRNPFLGIEILKSAYLSAFVWTLISILISVIIHKKFDRKIIFWV